jgi:hypothetical protein
MLDSTCTSPPGPDMYSYSTLSATTLRAAPRPGLRQVPAMRHELPMSLDFMIVPTTCTTSMQKRFKGTVGASFPRGGCCTSVAPLAVLSNIPPSPVPGGQRLLRLRNHVLVLAQMIDNRKLEQAKIERKLMRSSRSVPRRALVFSRAAVDEKTTRGRCGGGEARREFAGQLYSH